MGNSSFEEDTGRRERTERPVASGVRGTRLAELILEELGSLLGSEVGDPRLDGARLTRVEVSSDGSRARVGFVTERMCNEKEQRQLERVFRGAAGFFRRELCDVLALKRTPELTFAWDPLPLAIAKEND